MLVGVVGVPVFLHESLGVRVCGVAV